MSHRFIRLLHSTARSCNLVGPPDPISNLRPVLYNNNQAATELPHPYSLREFSGDVVRDHDLQWRLHQQQLDDFSHNFWTDVSANISPILQVKALMTWVQSNTRFEAGKRSVLSSLPESSTAIARERALSEFYRGWVQQEVQLQKVYTTEWRARSYDALKYAARIQWRNFQTWLNNYVKF